MQGVFKRLFTVLLIAVVTMTVVVVPILAKDSSPISWEKSFGGSSWDNFSSVRQTSDGGYIAVGESYSIDGDLKGINKGNYDAIMVKYNSTGNVTWKKSFGGADWDNFSSVQQTSDGGYVAVGLSYSTDGDLEGLNKGNSDGILVKYNSTGNVIWKKSFGGASWDFFNSVQQTSDGGYVAVGNSSSTDGDLSSSDAIIVKYNSTGNVTWKKSFGDTRSNYFNRVQQTSDGGFVVVGYSSLTDGDLSSSDAIIVKYNPTGNVIWKKSFGGAKEDRFGSVQQTSDGGYIAVGDSYSTDGDLERLNKGSSDAIIVKYNSSGNVIWKKSFGGAKEDGFGSVRQTSDGDYIAVGDSYLTDGDPDGPNHGNSDAIIVKYNSTGNVIWKKSFGGAKEDGFDSVQQTSDGGFVAVGYSSSTDGDLKGQNKGSSDAIIVKFRSIE